MSDASESQQPAMWAEAELLPLEPDPIPSEPEPEREPRLKPVNRKQLLWHAVDVEKLVGPDHLVRAIWELVGQLDLKAYTAEVGSVEGVAGRPAYDPRLLISLWIYAYSQKVGWAREVALRVRSCLSVADRDGGGELPHPGGFPRPVRKGSG